MSLLPLVKNEDWNAVRRNFQLLSSSLRIGPDAEPTFANLSLTGLTASRLLSSDTNNLLTSTDLASWVTETSNQVLVADNGDGTITLSTPQDIHTAATPTFAGLSILSSGDAKGTLSCTNSTITSDTTFTGLTLDYTKTSGTGGGFTGIELSLVHNNNANLSNLYALNVAVDFQQGTLTGESYLFYFSAQQSGGTIEDDIYCQHNVINFTTGLLEDDAHGFYQRVGVGSSHSGISGNLYACELEASDVYDKVSGSVYILYLKGNHVDYAIWDASGANWALDGDNQKIIFGEGQDNEIYHDGTDFVLDPGSGSVSITGPLTATGAGHFGGALDTDSTLVVDGTVAVGTTLDSTKNLNVYSSGNTITRAANLSVNYSGTSQSCYGVYCQALGRQDASQDNPRAYGARFQGINYRMKDQTGLAGTYGGDFRAQDYQNTVYGTAGGTYQFYCGYFYTPNAAGDWTTYDPTVKTYRLFLTGTPTGFGDNHTDYAIYSAGGQSIHAGNVRIGSTTDPVRTLDVTGDATFGDGGTTDYVKFDTDGKLTLYGTARVESHLRIPAQLFKKVVGGSPPGETMEGIIPTVDFDDSTNEQAYYVEVSPFKMDTTVDIEIEIDWMFDTNQADDTKKVKWGVEYISIEPGEAVDGATTTTTQLSAGNHNTGQGNMVRTAFETGLSGIAIGDVIGLRVFRDAVNDDFVGDARLIVLHLHFTVNKLGKPVT